MAKVSPVSIKYMIHANFAVEGALEKPDVIGAIFGQTEGLLGADLEMRELQKEGKIGRIEVDLHRDGKRTAGVIKIPTALDQSETTLIAAAVETIERIGPCDAQIEVERIEDVRGSKRDYIIERAKKLMGQIEGSTDSREISNEIKDSAKIAGVKEYGDEKLPCGDLFDREIIVVEGRADVLNLLRNGVNNVIAMNGTKLPDSIKELGERKELTLFVDGDRGGRLIAQNARDNARIKYIAIAPDGKEVEELTGKEIYMNLRRKIPIDEFFSRFNNSYQNGFNKPVKEEVKEIDLDNEKKSKLRKLSEANHGTGKAIFLNDSLEELKTISAKSLGITLKKTRTNPYALIVDGQITNPVIKAAEDAHVQIIVAKNFGATSDKVKLLSL
ncbi:MAG: DNA primase [Nanoarchaeota archaeon]|nr:DNA primase [Nanoarchaeota archaeon]